MIDASLLSPVISAAALLLAFLGYLRGGSAKLDGIAERLTRAETKLDLLMKDLSLVAASSLHREDDRHGLDRLLEGYEARTITREQLIELRARLTLLSETGEPRERMLARVMLRNMHDRYTQH